MAAEANSADLEDKYVTSLYIIMEKLGCADIEVIKRMPASTYMCLLEEMESQAKREKAEMDKAKRKRR